MRAPIGLSGDKLTLARSNANAHLPFFSRVTVLHFNEQSSVMKLWSNLLKVEASTIQPSSDFFDMGGHSLLLAKLAAALLKEFGVTVPIVSIIERPILGDLAEFLDSEMSSYESSAPSSVVPMTPAQRCEHICVIVCASLGSREEDTCDLCNAIEAEHEHCFLRFPDGGCLLFQCRVAFPRGTSFRLFIVEWELVDPSAHR